MRPRYWRQRPDGVIELLPRRPARVRELIFSTWLAVGGIALTVALATIVTARVPPDAFRRTAGVASVCFNWSAGPTGCWTR